MYKITVCLPDELAESLQAEMLRDPDIEVASVCRRALEREVLDLTSSRADESMLAAAARRLNLSRAAEQEGARSQGLSAGRDWVLRSATDAELERLALLLGSGALSSTEARAHDYRDDRSWPTLKDYFREYVTDANFVGTVPTRRWYDFLAGFEEGAISSAWAISAPAPAATSARPLAMAAS